MSAWRNFKIIFSRPLFIIIFRPKILFFVTYSILTGDTRVEFVNLTLLRTIYRIHKNRYLYKIMSKWLVLKKWLLSLHSSAPLKRHKKNRKICVSRFWGHADWTCSPSSREMSQIGTSCGDNLGSGRAISATFFCRCQFSTQFLGCGSI